MTLSRNLVICPIRVPALALCVCVGVWVWVCGWVGACAFHPRKDAPLISRKEKNIVLT